MFTSPELEDQLTSASSELNPVIHFPGTATFDGPYRVTAKALSNLYNGVKHAHFGSTEVGKPATYVVKDLLYRVDGEKVGMRIVPAASGEIGSKEIDAILRKAMGLSPSEPIYALIAHCQPQDYAGTLEEHVSGLAKVQMSQYHMGAYLGRGRTTHSPDTYASGWERLPAYPALVYTISLYGVPQAVLNRNAHWVDLCLNRGVKFPGNYLEARFRCIDLNTTLMFYRDWLRNESYLKNESTWFTYCSAHKTIAVNVALNVPHNQKWFSEIFGATQGAELFTVFKKHFKEIHGRDFTPADETDFRPLWHLQGYTPEQIRPFSKAEYDAYETARRSGELGKFDGRRPVGDAIAWRPESAADLTDFLLKTYAAFPYVRGVVSCKIVCGMMDKISERLGITKSHYLATVTPVLQRIMLADAMISAPNNPQYYGKVLGQLKQALGEPTAMAVLTAVRENLEEIAGKPPLEPLAAYRWLLSAFQADLQRAREQRVHGTEKKVQFLTTPAVAHRVAIGLYPKNRFVSIRAVCTAMDPSEVEKVQFTHEEETDMVEELAGSARELGAAEAILADFAGARYYENPAILQSFLSEWFGRDPNDQATAGAVERILSMVRGGAELPSAKALAGAMHEAGLP